MHRVLRGYLVCARQTLSNVSSKPAFDLNREAALPMTSGQGKRCATNGAFKALKDVAVRPFAITMLHITASSYSRDAPHKTFGTSTTLP